MPFTPLHMGPALALKSATSASFSLTVFGWSQILMDTQPLVVMLTNKGDLHGISHTLIGALLIGLLSAITGKYLGEIGLSIIRWKRYLPINWKTAFVSAFVGTISHVLIDSIMHVDVSPFYPFSSFNPLHGVISITLLHKICVISAVIGGVAFVLRENFRGKA